MVFRAITARVFWGINYQTLFGGIVEKWWLVESLSGRNSGSTKRVTLLSNMSWLSDFTETEASKKTGCIGFKVSNILEYIFFTWWLIGRNATVKIMVWNGFIHLKSRDIVNILWIEQWTRPNSGLTIKTMEFNQQYRRLKQVIQKGIGYRDNWWLICYYWFHKRMEVGRDGWWYLCHLEGSWEHSTVGCMQHKSG